MPTPVTPVDAWTTPLNIPADGEPANSASILQYMQVAANRLQFLRNRLIGASQQAVRLHVPVFAPGQANWTVSGTFYPNAFCSVSTLQTYYMPIQGWGASVGGQSSQPAITQIGCVLQGASGHAALPAIMPRLQLVSHLSAAAIGGSGAIPETVHADQVDTSANTAAYQVWHNVQQTLGVVVPYNPTAQYGLRLSSEAGANAIVGLTIGHAWIEITST